MLQAIWLSAIGQRHQTFMHLDTLEIHNPKLAQLIRRYPKMFWDGEYCYHLRPNGLYVIRWPDFLPKRLDYEKYRSHNPNHKLEEFNIK